jgi:hypothetical protein
MRIDKVNLDVYVAVPDEILGPDFSAESAGRAMVDALAMTLGPILTGTAINAAESLSEDEWLAAHEGEWAEANGFAI